jgi:hypothetical protein
MGKLCKLVFLGLDPFGLQVLQETLDMEGVTTLEDSKGKVFVFFVGHMCHARFKVLQPFNFVNIHKPKLVVYQSQTLPAPLMAEEEACGFGIHQV